MLASDPDTTRSPLVEPDVRISRARLSRSLSPQAFAGSCAVVVSQPYQSQSVEERIETHPFRQSEGPLAAPSQMVRETVSDVPVDVTESHWWIPEGEVVAPAFQVRIQHPDVIGEGHVVPSRSC